MDLVEALELFNDLKNRIQTYGDYLRQDEYRTRIVLIDPLLRLLGWDVEDVERVELEFRTAQSTQERADYLLRIDNRNVAVIEAKKLGTDMGFAARRQVKDYADYAEVSKCVLCDGSLWLLYDLDQGRNPETMQPRFQFEIESDSSADLALRCLMLWRPNMASENGPITAVNPLFTQNPQTDLESEEQQVRSTDDTQSSEISWLTLDQVEFQKGSDPPSCIVLGDYDSNPTRIDAWIELWVLVAEWLAATKPRSEWEKIVDLLPASSVKIHESTFWAGKTGHQLANGMWINRSLNVPNIGRFTNALIERLGVARSDVRVSYDATEN